MTLLGMDIESIRERLEIFLSENEVSIIVTDERRVHLMSKVEGSGEVFPVSSEIRGDR